VHDAQLVGSLQISPEADRVCCNGAQRLAAQSNSFGSVPGAVRREGPFC
jgi:hypothetical protein